jgi:hypothetical protein
MVDGRGVRRSCRRRIAMAGENPGIQRTRHERTPPVALRHGRARSKGEWIAVWAVYGFGAGFIVSAVAFFMSFFRWLKFVLVALAALFALVLVADAALLAFVFVALVA